MDTSGRMVHLRRRRVARRWFVAVLLKDSTIRTVLRRLEEKGYLTHELDGRTFIYKRPMRGQNVAVTRVRHHRPLLRRIGRAAVLGMGTTQCSTASNWKRLAKKIAEKKAVAGDQQGREQEGRQSYDADREPAASARCAGADRESRCAGCGAGRAAAAGLAAFR